jgi:hypothetical protein
MITMFKLFTDVNVAIELSDLIGGTVYRFGGLYRVYPPNTTKPQIDPFWVSAS